MTDESKKGLILSDEDTTYWQKIVESTDHDSVSVLVSEAVEPAKEKYKQLIVGCTHRQHIINGTAAMSFSWMSFAVLSSVATSGSHHIAGTLLGVLPSLIMMTCLHILDKRLKVQREMLVSDMKRLDEPGFAKLCFQYRILSLAKIKLAVHFDLDTLARLAGDQQFLRSQTSEKAVHLIVLCETYLQVTASLLSSQSNARVCLSTDRFSELVESIQILRTRAGLMKDQENMKDIQMLDEVGTNLLKVIRQLSPQTVDAE